MMRSPANYLVAGFCVILLGTACNSDFDSGVLVGAGLTGLVVATIVLATEEPQAYQTQPRQETVTSRAFSSPAVRRSSSPIYVSAPTSSYVHVHSSPTPRPSASAKPAPQPTPSPEVVFVYVEPSARPVPTPEPRSTPSQSLSREPAWNVRPPSVTRPSPSPSPTPRPVPVIVIEPATTQDALWGLSQP